VRAARGPSWSYAILDAAYATGLLLGALIGVSKFKSLIGRRNSVCVGYAMIAAPMLACGFLLPYLNMFAISTFIALCPLFCVAGCGYMLVNVNGFVVRSLAVPKEYRSAIFGAIGFVSSVALPMGSASITIASRHWSLSGIEAVLAIVVLACAAVSLRIRDMRDVMDQPDALLKDRYVTMYPRAF